MSPLEVVVVSSPQPTVKQPTAINANNERMRASLVW
jgi:hypothetical protein